MPALAGLEDRLQDANDWKRDYADQLQAAEGICQQSRLFHNVKSSYAMTVLFEDSTLKPPLAAGGHGEASTRQSEEKAGLKSAVYFYLGRVFPRTGGLALAFAARIMRSWADTAGEAFPFDTGGIFSHVTFGSRVDHAQFVRDSRISLSDCLNQFRRFLAAYFKPCNHYFTGGRPYQSDPEGIFHHPANSWRAWTFEIRCKEEVQADETTIEKWCASRDVNTQFDLRVIEPQSDLDHARLRALSERRLEPEDDFHDYRQTMEQWQIGRLPNLL